MYCFDHRKIFSKLILDVLENNLNKVCRRIETSLLINRLILDGSILINKIDNLVFAIIIEDHDSLFDLLEEANFKTEVFYVKSRILRV
jgi:hypothetical protein